MAARTGLAARTETLPNAELVCSSYSPSDAELSEACHTLTTAAGQAHALQRRLDKYQKQFPRPQACPRKVVFSYRDAYTFSRVVMADDLVFDAHFESGNLMQASRIKTASGSMEYELLLTPDPSKKGHVQWFFFSVKNMRARTPYTFHIVNFMKAQSMYQCGMKPCVYSSIAASEMGKGWHRTDFPIAGEPSSIGYYRVPRGCEDGQRTFILTFTHVFPFDKDVVYFASCFPYTYTDLKQHLSAFCASPSKHVHVDRSVLCVTAGGNACDLLTLHDGGARRPLAARKLIVISGRVHPGESNASWMVHGILQFLFTDSTEARWLLSRYVFKIVPMLNPDGVINGFYRTSLSGHDMNRCWDAPDPVLHAPIAKLKELLADACVYPGVDLFCDVHGHSRKEGIFMYGCVPPSSMSASRNLPRVLPMLLSKTCPAFKYEGCDFKMPASKASTARIVAFSELGITHAFTLEASLCGFNNRHFRICDLIQAGDSFCRALAMFLRIRRKAKLAVGLQAQSAASSAKPASSPCTPVRRAVASDMPSFALSHSKEYFQSISALLAHHVDAGLTEAGHFISPALLSVPEDVQAAVDKVADLDMSFSLRAHSYPDRITSVHTSPLTPQVTGSIKRASPLSSSPRDAASTPAVPSLVLPDASSGLHQFADEPSEVELSGWEFLRELQTPDLWFLPPALQEFATAAPSAPRRSPPQSTLAASEGSPTEPASAHKSVARGSILPSIGASAPGRGIFVRAPSPISDPAASAGGTLPSPRVNRLSFPSITPVLQTRVTLDLVADAVPVARAFVGTAQPRKAGVGALRQQPPRQSRASSAALADASSAPRLHPRGSLVAANGRRGNRKSLSAISR